ncbi:C-type lectin domain family 19 member A-like [Diadema antillarum]|uniref:C-type lectin domain family 19 member A-like n=1 Tax=Diadema antillarum TaxID=105358 RepID=UPI003A8885F5
MGLNSSQPIPQRCPATTASSVQTTVKKMNLLLTILLVTVAMAALTSAESCPVFWHLFDGNCYRYFGKRVNWAEAEASCKEYLSTQGMAHLISLNTEDENRFAYELYHSSVGDTPDWQYDNANRRPFNGFWTGLHQNEADGPWIYTDDSEYDYENWLPGEPNNNYYNEQAEDCVHVWRRNANDDNIRGWNDVYCQEVMPFICEVEANDP